MAARSRRIAAHIIQQNHALLPDHIPIEGKFDPPSRSGVDLASQGRRRLPAAAAIRRSRMEHGDSKRWQLNAAAQVKRDVAAAARRRIAALKASLPDLLLNHALGVEGAAPPLQAVHDQIVALEKNL